MIRKYCCHCRSVNQEK